MAPEESTFAVMVDFNDPVAVSELVDFLRREPRESEWIEFKANNDNPERIARYVSALSNGACMEGKQFAYMVWGLEDETRRIVGTTFDPKSKRKGNQPFELWLATNVHGSVTVNFGACEIDGRRLVVARIGQAVSNPTRYNGIAYIRIGEATPQLADHPDKERRLWQALSSVSFEGLVAAERLTEADLLDTLDLKGITRLHNLPVHQTHGSWIPRLQSYGLIERSESGGWSLRNVGALLYAKRIEQFPHLQRKAIRVIRYVENRKIETERERVGTMGYAVGFEGIIKYLQTQLPRREKIGQALRVSESIYPSIAIRELLANTLIHQDLQVTGAGPLVEIFDNRIEFTNPGEPLIPTDRFLDSPARSRNEAVARLMRTMGICEERGSGIDKIVDATEIHQLPSPKFQVVGGSTVCTLFAPKALADMDSEERVRACYMHACLRHVNHEFATNASLRTRFKLSDTESVATSRMIRETLTAGRIKIHDEEVGYRARKYSPYWA